MKKKELGVGRRAWNLLRLALLWARKGGALKNRRIMLDLRLLPKYLKGLSSHSHSSSSKPTLRYGERELSFEDTPIVHVKMIRRRFKLPHIPCINPPIDFDYDFESIGNDDDNRLYAAPARTSFLRNKAENEEEEEDDDRDSELWDEDDDDDDDEGIDLKAEEFIAKFYQQMRLQRQISRLQQHE